MSIFVVLVRTVGQQGVLERKVEESLSVETLRGKREREEKLL